MNAFHKKIIIPVCAIFSFTLTSFDLYGANKRKERDPQSVVDLTGDDEVKESTVSLSDISVQEGRPKKRKRGVRDARQRATIEVVDLSDDGVEVQAESSSVSSPTSDVASSEQGSSGAAPVVRRVSSPCLLPQEVKTESTSVFNQQSVIHESNYQELSKIIFTYEYRNHDVQAKDYYAILGIARYTSNAKVIKAAYRKLALEWHPDKNLTRKELAEAIFKLLTEANEVLSDPGHRAVYNKCFFLDYAKKISYESLQKVMHMMRAAPGWMWSHQVPLVLFMLVLGLC